MGENASWREALIDATKGVDHAYDRRRRIYQTAYDAGLTMQAIADVVGLSQTAVHKIIGNQGRHRDVAALLESPSHESDDA
jgi:DNA-directed RNA polymerase specialized sigma subunit